MRQPLTISCSSVAIVCKCTDAVDWIASDPPGHNVLACCSPCSTPVAGVKDKRGTRLEDAGGCSTHSLHHAAGQAGRGLQLHQPVRALPERCAPDPAPIPVAHVDLQQRGGLLGYLRLPALHSGHVISRDGCLDRWCCCSSMLPVIISEP